MQKQVKSNFSCEYIKKWFSKISAQISTPVHSNTPYGKKYC